MKKKYRDIVVNGVNYAWSVSRPNCDGDGNNRITIWRDKKIIYSNVVRHLVKVTPRFISLFINLNKL